MIKCDQCGKEPINSFSYCKMCGKRLCNDCDEECQGYCESCMPVVRIDRAFAVFEAEFNRLKHVVNTELDRREVMILRRDRRKEKVVQ